MIEKLLRTQSRAIILVALAMALAGIVAALSLPIGLFPQVSFPAWSSTSIPEAARQTRPP